MKRFLLGLVLALGALLAPISAQAAECTLYEQSHPAFTLDGAHLSTGKCNTCATCHRNGIFTGTPKTCVACHNGDPARVTVGRSAAHIPTNLLDCGNCHYTSSFTAAWSMKHSIVTAQRCDTCHNGNFATGYNALGKKVNHVVTTADCITCHVAPADGASGTFVGVSHATTHAGVTTGCVTCHNNVIAIGKAGYAAHPVTSDNCETCHSIDAGFKCASLPIKMQDLANVMLKAYRKVFA